MKTDTEAQWPYSTLDEVSHLAIEDPRVLRARIDQLLEERREFRKAMGYGEVVLPADWRLTPQEHRLVEELVRTPATVVATKERLHAAANGREDPDTELKLVDVLVCKVRRKLTAHVGPDAIETVWGRGYRLSKTVRDLLRA